MAPFLARTALSVVDGHIVRGSQRRRVSLLRDFQSWIEAHGGMSMLISKRSSSSNPLTSPLCRPFCSRDSLVLASTVILVRRNSA